MFIKIRFYNRIKYNESHDYQNYNQNYQNYNQQHHHHYHHQHNICYDADGDLTKKSCDRSINYQGSIIEIDNDNLRKGLNIRAPDVEKNLSPINHGNYCF